MRSEELTIAVVEDEDELRCNITTFLQGRGYCCWGAVSAEELYRHLLVQQADLVLVDINLPGEDGFSLLSHLATSGRYGLIAMTARGETADRIRGLESGADMYFVKPVDLYELEAGIRAVLRRNPSQTPEEPKKVRQGWVLDYVNSCLVAPDSRTMELTSRELAFLGCLMVECGQTVLKNTLQEACCDSNHDDFHRIETLLYRLRKKSEQSLEQNLPVRAVFGKGMVFTDNASLRGL